MSRTSGGSRGPRSTLVVGVALALAAAGAAWGDGDPPAAGAGSAAVVAPAPAATAPATPADTTTVHVAAPARVGTADPAHAQVAGPAAGARPAEGPARESRARSGFGSAVVALVDLILGNRRFAEGPSTQPHARLAARGGPAQGRRPVAVVVACADSPEPPERLFDQPSGALYVVRIAGNALDAMSVAGIEYAIGRLGVPLVVVLGHHGCAAVRTALEVEPAAAGSPDLAALVAAIRPRVGAYLPPDPAERTLDGPVRANADAVCEDLLRRSGIVRARVEAARLALVPAVHVTATGRVGFWGGALEAESQAIAPAAPGTADGPTTTVHDER